MADIASAAADKRPYWFDLEPFQSDWWAVDTANHVSRSHTKPSAIETAEGFFFGRCPFCRKALASQTTTEGNGPSKSQSR